MFASMLESIKSEKQLSFNHWRYRLLHWFFGISPATVEESSLPRFFYTHFCPLFHFTNIVAIFSPVILAWKLLWLLGTVVVSLFNFCEPYITFVADHLIDFLARFMPKDKWELSSEEREVINKQERIAKLQKSIRSWYEYFNDTDDLDKFTFNYFCALCSQYSSNDKEAEEVFDILFTKLKERDDKRKLAAEKRRAWILFWVNFSQVFVKWGLNLGYAGLAVLVAYLSFTWGPPLIFGFCGMMWDVGATLLTINVFDFLYGVAIWTFRIVVPAAIIGAVAAIIISRKSAVADGLIKVCSPLVVLGTAIKSLFEAIAKGWESTADFIKVFYEESCPPIKIVSTDPIGDE